MATKKAKTLKHPRADHPATGRLNHNFTTKITAEHNVNRGKSKDSPFCTMCGMDAAYHDLTIDDYTGSPEGLDAYLRGGAPAGPFTVEEKARNTPR